MKVQVVCAAQHNLRFNEKLSKVIYNTHDESTDFIYDNDFHSRD